MCVCEYESLNVYTGMSEYLDGGRQPSLRYITHAGDNSVTVPATLGTYTCIAYKICHVVSTCADIWITKISNQLFSFLDISLIFCVFVKHWGCVHLGLITLICFII